MKLRSYARLLALSFVVVSGIVIAWGPAGAQGAARERETGTLPFTPQLNGRPGASTPINHVLKGTIFDAGSPGASASCSSAGCSAYAQMYLESVVCPRIAGATCTYQITIQSQNHAGCLLYVERSEPSFFVTNPWDFLRGHGDRHQQ